MLGDCIMALGRHDIVEIAEVKRPDFTVPIKWSLSELFVEYP